MELNENYGIGPIKYISSGKRPSTDQTQFGVKGTYRKLVTSSTTFKKSGFLDFQDLESGFFQITDQGNVRPGLSYALFGYEYNIVKI